MSVLLFKRFLADGSVKIPKCMKDISRKEIRDWHERDEWRKRPEIYPHVRRKLARVEFADRNYTDIWFFFEDESHVKNTKTLVSDYTDSLPVGGKFFYFIKKSAFTFVIYDDMEAVEKRLDCMVKTSKPYYTKNSYRGTILFPFYERFCDYPKILVE